MYQPTENDYVLITDKNNDCYLQVGKIVEIIYEPHDNYVRTYIVEFFDHHLKIPYRLTCRGTIFEDGEAKVLNFKG